MGSYIFKRLFSTKPFFLTNGIDVTLQDNSGFTPLHYCVLYNSYNICKEILKINHNAVNIEDNNGNQPLFLLVTTFLRNNKEEGLFRLILKHCNANNINHQNKLGKSPLDIAKTLIGYEKVVDLLNASLNNSQNFK